MPTFSRWMPPHRGPSAFLRWGGLVVLTAAALWFLVRYYPFVPAATVLAVILLLIFERRRAVEIRRLARERHGESICTFARAFSRVEREPHIIRAVYEELLSYRAAGQTMVPLRRTDSLDRDLGLDSEELELAIVVIAGRAGRSLENPSANPYYTKVTTVGDVVEFLRAQPRVVAA